MGHCAQHTAPCVLSWRHAEACANDEKDAILGVQQSRNAMSACTYLATIRWGARGRARMARQACVGERRPHTRAPQRGGLPGIVATSSHVERRRPPQAQVHTQVTCALCRRCVRARAPHRRVRSVALATAGLTIIFDENKTARIHQLAVSVFTGRCGRVRGRQHLWCTRLTRSCLERAQVNDPIMRHLPGGPLVPPVAILGAALGSLYASFICFAQSVRLYVHVGFYVRACTSSFNPGEGRRCRPGRHQPWLGDDDNCSRLQRHAQWLVLHPLDAPLLGRTHARADSPVYVLRAAATTTRHAHRGRGQARDNICRARVLRCVRHLSPLGAPSARTACTRAVRPSLRAAAELRMRVAAPSCSCRCSCLHRRCRWPSCSGAASLLFLHSPGAHRAHTWGVACHAVHAPTCVARAPTRARWHCCCCCLCCLCCR
jgi:hypothetical protein